MKRLNQNGLSLLEVIIVMTILAFLSIRTAQSIKDGVLEKQWIEKKLERETQLRDALAIMSSDIRMAFNYRDINIEVFNMAQDKRKKAYLDKSKKGTTPTNPDEANPPTTDTEGGTPGLSQSAQSTKTKTFDKKTERIFTQFLGEKSELHFTSRSLRRSVENSQASSLGEIGYIVKSCKNRVNKEIQTECLWRRTAPVIDNKVNEGGRETVLLENIERFELRYIGPKREEDWTDSWLTDERGDAITRNIFPYAVEITLSIRGDESKDEKPLAMTVVSALEFPNNVVKKPTTADAATTQGVPPASTSQ